MRQLVVDGETWEFTVGRSHIRIVSPAGKSHDVACHTIVGGTPNDFERGQWKKTSDGMVTPKRVCNYIREVIRPAQPTTKQS